MEEVVVGAGLTRPEREFLLKVLDQLTVNMADPDSIKACTMVHSIKAKLRPSIDVDDESES